MARLVSAPLIVVAIVVVKATSPEELVIVWIGAPTDGAVVAGEDAAGTLTTATLVGVPLIVVGNVVVKATLPDVVVTVSKVPTGLFTTATLVRTPSIVVGTVVVCGAPVPDVTVTV